MKTLLIIFLLLFMTVTQAQHFDYQIDERGDYFYQKTYVIDSTTSNELIDRSKNWVYEIFNTNTNYELLKYEKINSHVIFINAKIHHTTFNIQIETKNNHVRLTISDIAYYQKRKGGYSSTEVRNGCKEDIYLNINSSIFFKKDGQLKKSTTELYNSINNNMIKLFYSLENALNEKIINNNEWEK